MMSTNLALALLSANCDVSKSALAGSRPKRNYILHKETLKSDWNDQHDMKARLFNCSTIESLERWVSHQSLFLKLSVCELLNVARFSMYFFLFGSIFWLFFCICYSHSINVNLPCTMHEVLVCIDLCIFVVSFLDKTFKVFDKWNISQMLHITNCMHLWFYL